MANNFKANKHKIDESVQVPDAVRRAAERADELQKQATTPPAEPPAPEPAPIANPDTIRIAEPPAPEPVGQTTVSDTPVTPSGNEPQIDDNDLSWKHKFESAQGRWRQEREARNLLQQRVDDLENLIETTRSAPPAEPAQPQPVRLLTDQERNDFGPEMLDVVGKRAAEVITPELAELRANMQRLQSRLDGTEQQVKTDKRKDMFDGLTAAIPNWREVNVSDDFKMWLGLPDAYTGAKRHNLLMQAFEQNDTPRVLAFFKGFLAEEAALVPATTQTLAPAVPPAPPKPGLEQFAAPGRAKTPAGGNAPVEKPIITTAEINAFYAAKRRGLYAGKEEEATRLEAMIFEAQREGRIRTT